MAAVAGAAMTFIVICPSPARSGDPWFNLSWYLQELVASATMGHDVHAEWRREDPFATEMRLRAGTRDDAVWIERTPYREHSADARCEDFTVLTFANWKHGLAEDTDSVPQWREVWHGVWADAKFSAASGQIHDIGGLVAAVRSPAIPPDAFVAGPGGALAQAVFKASQALYRCGFRPAWRGGCSIADAIGKPADLRWVQHLPLGF